MTRMNLGIAVIMAGILCVIGFALSVRNSSVDEPGATGENGPAGLSRFYTQKLVWTDCGTYQCTWVKVPVDYDKPEGETLRIRVKVRPGNANKSTGKLFINPGGPGGSGVDFVDYFATRTSVAIREAYDIVGFDPRGVGQSDPLECLSDKEFDKFTNLDPDPDDDAEVQGILKGTKALADGCGKNSGELAKHVSTYEAAKDIDIMRVLLGETSLDYYGASYGTQLGATYADLFPSKVGKMILDGAIDPTLDDETLALGQAEGFQRALDSFIKACVKTVSCPLGSDEEGANLKLSSFLAQLDAKPLKTNSKRKVTEATAFYGIAVTLYDKDHWPALLQELTDAFKGDGTFMLYLADQYFGRQPDGSYRDNASQAIFAVRCLDTPKRSTIERIKASEPKFVKASPVWGRTMAWSPLNCAEWPYKSKHPQAPVDAKGASPILVVGTTRDPATPYEWSQALAKQLDSGVLVSREGDGHTGYHSGNPCIDSIVNKFLLEDVVPKDGVKCKAP